MTSGVQQQLFVSRVSDFRSLSGVESCKRWVDSLTGFCSEVTRISAYSRDEGYLAVRQCPSHLQNAISNENQEMSAHG